MIVKIFYTRPRIPEEECLDAFKVMGSMWSVYCKSYRHYQAMHLEKLGYLKLGNVKKDPLHLFILQYEPTEFGQTYLNFYKL
jgi:hypothetical protein